MYMKEVFQNRKTFRNSTLIQLENLENLLGATKKNGWDREFFNIYDLKLKSRD